MRAEGCLINYRALRTKLRKVDISSPLDRNLNVDLVREIQNVPYAPPDFWMKDDYRYGNPPAGRFLSKEDRDIISFLNKALEKGYDYVLFTQKITPHKAIKKYRDDLNIKRMKGVLENIFSLTEINFITK